MSDLAVGMTILGATWLIGNVALVVLGALSHRHTRRAPGERRKTWP